MGTTLLSIFDTTLSLLATIIFSEGSLLPRHRRVALLLVRWPTHKWLFLASSTAFTATTSSCDGEDPELLHWRLSQG